MDRVADCDVLWREITTDETVTAIELKKHFTALKEAWEGWVLAYSNWVKAHADHRVDEAKRWLPRVNEE